ncbi:metal-dependent hydrolase [Actinocorallia lasiicapitis]
MSEIDERHPLIKARRVVFDWEATPLHWIPGDPLASHLINYFQVLLTTGEKWFIQCVQDAVPLLPPDELLRAEIRGFIGQEMVHSRSHQRVLDLLLRREGIDVRPITAIAEGKLAARPVEIAELARTAPRRHRARLLFELGVVAAVEHYTAVLGQWIIENDRLDAVGADPTMLDLFRWHGAEEVEHRSVVFDVYERVGGGYPLRVLSWGVAVFFLLLTLVQGTAYLMREDPSIIRKPTARRLLRSYRASVRRGHLPGVVALLLGEGRIYLRRGHHPSQVCSTRAALD